LTASGEAADEEPPAQAKRPRSAWGMAVPAVFAIAGLLLATSAATSQGTDLRAGRRTQLADLIRASQSEVAGLSAESIRLRGEVEARTRAQAANDSRVAAVRAAADALAGPTGLLPISGEGLSVALGDAPKPKPDTHYPPGVPSPSPDDLVVHQQDVQSVVNALWAGGAAGVTIMGQRVISTSAVRCVGNTLLLHGVVYSPPFVITAVGNVNRLEASIDGATGVALFRQYVAAYGLQFDVRTLRVVTLPGYTGPIELAHAKAVGG
jgi:uncharacterized protein YlxW (UPF0749 family)